MTKVCLMITKPPHSEEETERFYGLVERAYERNMDVTVYLLGDGILCVKKGQQGIIGRNIRSALEHGVVIKASAKDLRARAFSEEQVETGVEIIEELEEQFVVDIMENADRVISW